MNERDDLFTQPIDKKFEFDQAVASVFDDMLSRSVPFYDEVRSLVVALIVAEAHEGSRVIDMGSSTAQLLLELHARTPVRLALTGVDNSEAMVERARQKAQAFGAEEIDLILGDILAFDYRGYDIAVANYTLQFIRPMQRLELVAKLGRELSDGGLFVFSEKVVFDDKRLDKEIIDIYYDFKRARGYSDFEIAQKREALENVLIPFTIAENITMCKDAGFSEVSTIFQWANFVTFVARK
jgi:tRNA (cmo5U34)-methyltransferase